LIKVSELRTILGNLQKFCESTGAKTASKDLQVFSDMLKPYSEVEVGSACADITQSIATPKAPRAPKPPKVPKEPVLDDGVIRHHLIELRNAGNDRNAFDLALKNLKESKSIKLPVHAEIARQFSLSEKSYKSKAAAHSDIEKAFVRQGRFENKVR
jgi:hypothetical protein